MAFPKDFLFGTATASAQVEGGGFEDGRGASIWDAFAEKAGAIADGLKPSRACDSYHRFERDIANMKFLGCDTYRMSISWGRVLPEGTGALNEKGMDYYRRCFDKLNENGIAPNVTLYHWDLPQALEEKGGWVNRDCPYRFAEYADRMFRAFGDVVPMWVCVNEPIATYVGYALGIFAPGYTDRKKGNQARHNVMTAAGAGVEAFRQSGAKGKVGHVIDIWKRFPFEQTAEDIALARDEDEENWKFYTDRLLGGGYSPYILEKFAKEGVLPDMQPEDFRLSSLPVDFYGMNYYDTVTVNAGDPHALSAENGGNFADTRGRKHPERIGQILKMIVDRYDLKIPLYISENGYADGMDLPSADGKYHDSARIAYLEKALASVEQAIGEGLPIKGYYLWSLMDNFEWCAGGQSQLGLFHTDFDTFETVPKDSAFWYRDFIRAARG